MSEPASTQSAPAPRLRVVCSYCPTIIAEGDVGAKVSHGICDPCFRRELAAIPEAAAAAVA